MSSNSLVRSLGLCIKRDPMDTILYRPLRVAETVSKKFKFRKETRTRLSPWISLGLDFVRYPRQVSDADIRRKFATNKRPILRGRIPLSSYSEQIKLAVDHRVHNKNTSAGRKLGSSRARELPASRVTPRERAPLCYTPAERKDR